jgi:hypothetical protein
MDRGRGRAVRAFPVRVHAGAIVSKERLHPLPCAGYKRILACHGRYLRLVVASRREDWGTCHEDQGEREHHRLLHAFSKHVFSPLFPRRASRPEVAARRPGACVERFSVPIVARMRFLCRS